MKFLDVLKTKTFWFGAIAVIGGVAGKDPPPTWQEWMLAAAAILTLAAGRQALGKAAAGKARAVLAWLVASAAVAGLAPAASSAPVVPYGCVTVDRLSGPDAWSTGFEVGVEATKDVVYLLGSYSVHDWLSEGDDAYPWDSTFRLEAGLYDSGHSLLGVGITPYGGLALTRPSGPQMWSLAFTAGVEADFDGFWLRFANDWQDVVTADASEVYPWNSTFRLGAGVYFGDDGDKGTKTRTGRARASQVLLGRE